jgi:hypothetical protein
MHDEIVEVAREGAARREAMEPPCEDDDCSDGEHSHSSAPPLTISSVSSPHDLTRLLALSSCHSSLYESSPFDDLFPPVDGTALFSTACKMNHACEPNVFVQYRGGWGSGRPLVLEGVAVRDIEEGEELTIGYVDCDMDWRDRREELESYGFVCACEKCLADVAAEGEGELEAEAEGEGEGEEDEDEDDEEELAREDEQAALALLRTRIDNDYRTPASLANSVTENLPSSFIPVSCMEQTAEWIRNKCGGDPAAQPLLQAVAEKNLRLVRLEGMEIDGEGAKVACALALAHESRWLEAEALLRAVGDWEGALGEAGIGELLGLVRANAV